MIGKTTVIVSGLPRSGTSLMMQMLVAGGLDALADGLREADDDNPRGYLELEEVKGTASDAGWVDRARGKVVKVISQLLPSLPADREYRVIFMRRNLDEILASQKRMLERRGEPWQDDDESMKSVLAAHVEESETWLRTAEHAQVLFVSYNRLVGDPGPQIERVRNFVHDGLDAGAMATKLDPELYRNRKQ